MSDLQQRKHRQELDAIYNARVKVDSFENKVVNPDYTPTTDTSVDSYTDAVSPITKTCPECKEIVRTHVKVCPDCGYEFENVPDPPQKNNNSDLEVSGEINVLPTKPRAAKRKKKKGKTLTKEQTEARDQKREREKQEAMERVAELKSQRNEKEKRKKRKKKKTHPLVDAFEKEHPEMREHRKNKKDAKSRKIWNNGFRKYEREQEALKKEKQEKECFLQRGEQCALKKYEKKRKKWEKEERKKIREEKRKEKYAAFDTLQRFRREYLINYPKDNPFEPRANENAIDYEYLSRVTDNIDSTFVKDDSVVIYKRRNGATVRVYIGADYRTYKQQQNKRNSEKWNTAVEQSLGASIKEVFRLARTGLCLSPLVFGQNIPMGSEYSITNGNGHLCYKNGDLIYGVRDATSLLGILRKMFRFDKHGISPYNMAVATGNVTVLDWDSFWEEPTQRYVKSFVRKYGKIKRAFVVITPGSEKHAPGIHLYLLKCKGIKSTNIIAGSLDIKNDSHAYVCAPGSVKEKGCYHSMDSTWAKEHEEEYRMICELVEDPIFFEDFESIKKLGSLTEIQKEGILDIIKSRYTGEPYLDLDDEELTEEERQQKQDHAAQHTYTMNEDDEVLRFEEGLKSSKRKHTCTPDIIKDKKIDDEDSNEIPITTQQTAISPSEEVIKVKVTQDTTMPIDDAVRELFGYSQAATYDNIKKVWLSPERNTLLIHPGWRDVYLYPNDYGDETDLDKIYRLWKTKVSEIPVGNRNLALTSLVGHLCCENRPLPTLKVLTKTMLLCSKELKEPLPEKEIEKICASIHATSLKKRGGDPDVVFKKKSKLESESENNRIIKDVFTKVERMRKWIETNAEPHTKEIYQKAFELVIIGDWNFDADESEYFDISEFTKLATGNTTYNHSDSQTAVNALRKILSCFLPDSKLVSKIKRVNYDDGHQERHSVITGITCTYNHQYFVQKPNNVSETSPVTDSNNPLFLSLGLINDNGGFNLVRHKNTDNSGKVSRDNVEKEVYRGCLGITKEEISSRMLKSFILYLDRRFSCDFLGEFFRRVDLKMSNSCTQSC
jgi:hypothetical protein